MTEGIRGRFQSISLQHTSFIMSSTQYFRLTSQHKTSDHLITAYVLSNFTDHVSDQLIAAYLLTNSTDHKFSDNPLRNSFISTNLMHNSYINYIKLNASTCFERHPPILRRSVSLIVHVCSLWDSHSLQVAVLCTC